MHKPTASNLSATSFETASVMEFGFYSPAAECHRTLAGTHSPSRRGQEAELVWVIKLILLKIKICKHYAYHT